MQQYYRWQGHLPLASAKLLPTFDRAGRVGTPFSPAERALFLACEFWGAISARRLVGHLGEDSLGALRYMTIIYSAIGAHRVVNAMIVAIGELECTSMPEERYQRLVALQARLLTTRDPVDELIVHLAENLGFGQSAAEPRMVSNVA